MASLSTLPIEMIREIGDHLDSPRELLEFSLICKCTNSAFTLTDLAIKDAERLTAVRKYMRQIFAEMRSQRDIDRCSVDIHRCPVDIHQPLLLWAIKTGKDADYLKQCLEVYQKSNPDCLFGRWYDWDAERLFRKHGLPRFPEPMTLAGKVGNMLAVQKLHESLVETGRTPTDIFINAEGGFKAACKAGHEDVACFMLSNGIVDATEIDPWYVVKQGRPQILSFLLGQPFFRGEYGEEIKMEALLTALDSEIRNLDIILPLFNAISLSDSEKTKFLKEQIIEEVLDPVWSSSPELQDRCANYAPKAIYLLGILEKLSSPPIEAGDIVREAAKRDCLLDVIKYVLSRPFYTIGKSENERSQVMQDALSVAIRFHAEETVDFLLSRGCPCSTIHFYQAIQSGELQMMDKVINSGVSVNSSFDFGREALDLKIKQREFHPYVVGDKIFKTPLQVALSTYERKTIKSFYMMFRLLSLGADYLNFPGEDRAYLYKCLCKKRFYKYLHQRNVEDELEEKPSRLDFSNLAPIMERHESREENEMTHAMCRLILGDNYPEKLYAHVEKCIVDEDRTYCTHSYRHLNEMEGGYWSSTSWPCEDEAWYQVPDFDAESTDPSSSDHEHWYEA
ncbi:hypothetical protein F4805DRAFT_454492 [Annulohypoxylon moriforme]|nr:hypothetical protein F4805DRAFT_454492 [Annulohypoxylon moriforme]